MPRIAIVTDSGCDLSPALQERYGVHVVPLVVRFGSETFLDGQLTAEEFWDKVLRGTAHPETSQPSAGMFEEAFAACVEQGAQVLCLTITSKHSGTYNSAFAASQSFPGQVTIFDTLSLSLGQGYQAIIAAQAAASGKDLPEILRQLERVRAATHLYIALDTIEYLSRGGRADSIIPTLERVARVLNIKPVLELVDGQLKFLGVDRSHDKSVQRIRQEVARRSPAEMLVVVHTRQSEEASALASKLAADLQFPAEQVLVAEAGPALSSHAGPGVVAAAIAQQTTA